MSHRALGTLAATLALATVAAAILMATCKQQPQPTPSPSPGSSTPTPTPFPPTSLKPPLGGLLDRSGPPTAEYASVMGGFVVNVHWSDIQPQPGAPIPDGNPIDEAIATLQQLDPSGRMGIKVRLFAGIYAPDWAKALGGPPIPIVDPVTGAAGTIGRFWNDDFGAAYLDLQKELAAKYDTAPEIREITISRCTTAYAEPFIRDISSASTVSGLLSSGFTVAADQRCHREEILAHQVWLHTRSDLSFNPYQVISGSTRTSQTFTEDMLAFCRSSLGARCVLANNSLRTPLQFPWLYADIKSFGPPIAFQTAVMAKVGNLGATLETAISLGACSVELPGGFQTLGMSALADYNRRLAANAVSSA
jgi:hypothetical protein